MSIPVGSDAAQILHLVRGQENGVSTEQICSALNCAPQQIGDVFEALIESGEVLGFAGLWFQPAAIELGQQRLLSSLLLLHSEQPTKSGVNRDRAITKAGLRWGGKPLDRIISAMVDKGLLREDGDEIAHTGFRLTLNTRQEELVVRVETAMRAAGYSTPTPRELTAQLGVPPQAVEQILLVAEHAGRIVEIAPDIYYLPEQLDAMKEVARGLTSPFTAAEFRDAVNTSRKYTIPLLERWDAEGFTKREEDARVVIG